MISCVDRIRGLTFFLLPLALVISCAASAAGQAESTLKLRPTPEPLPTPEWLQDAQTFLFDVRTPDEALQRKVKIICGGTNAGGPGYAGGPYLWDGKDKIYNMWTGEAVDVASIRARVREAHAKGLKVIGELMRMWHQELLYVQHPEWQEITSPDSKPRGPELKKEWPPVTGCWNSPFGDFYIQQTVRLMKELEWDGANLDGFGCWTTCYCPACRDSHRQDTGKDIPFKPGPTAGAPGVQATSVADLNDPDFRQYLKWRLNRFSGFVDRWQRAVCSENPDFASFFWSSGPGRWWHWSFAPLAECSDAANRLLNAPMLELFWDFPPDQGSNLLPSFTVRYYRGLTAERPVWMLPYFCTQGQQPAVAPPVECAFRVLTVITSGGRVAQGTWQNSNALPPDYYSKLIIEREPWTKRAKSMKWAALLVSESSRLLHNIPGRRSELKGGWIGSGVDTPDNSKLAPGERRLPAHMESAIGVFRAALEERLPIDMIVEQDVEDSRALGLYKVLILPNAACLSQKAIASIKDFVKEGGGLVALQESSLCDEFGSLRGDFGLAEVFGASFEGVEDHTARWPDYPNPISLVLAPHGITQDDVIKFNFRYNEKHVDFIGVTAKVKAREGAEVIARMGKNPSEPQDPFLILSTCGKGRSSYFAADIGQSYFCAPYQYQRKLIAGAARWSAGERQPPIAVVAPMCVQVAFYEQEGGQRKIVHLLNEINTTGSRAIPEGNSSMREEVVPIEGIKVRFAGRIRKATLQPEGIDLPLAEVAGPTEVTVPRLMLHSMVVAEE